MTRRGWLLFATVGVVWGIPYLLIRVAVGSYSPAGVVFMRTAIGALLLLPITAWRGELRPVLAHWRAVLLFAVIEIAGPWWLLSDAERRLPSSLSGLLVAAVPLVGALLAWLTRSDEQLGARRIAGLLVGIAGVALLVGFDVAGSDIGAAGEIALVVVGYAVGPIIIVRRLAGLPSTGIVAAALTATALVYLPVAMLQLPHVAPDVLTTLAAVALGVVCTAFAFPMFFELVRETGPVRATVVAYVNPAIAVLAGVLILHEPFTAAIAAGFVLIVAGSYLATRRTRRRAPPVRSAERAATVETPRDAVAPG